MIFGWISFSLYVTVLVSALRRKKKFSTKEMCFLNVVLLNSVAELALFLYIEIGIRARKYSVRVFYGSTVPASWMARTLVCLSVLLRNCTFLGVITLAVNRFTAIQYPLKYSKMWSMKCAVCVSLLNWTIATAIAVPAVVAEGECVSFFISPLHTLEILYDYTKTKILRLAAIVLCFLAVFVCSCLYGLLGYIILKAKYLKRRQIVSSLERKYLICALLTFVPLFFELARSIYQNYEISSSAPEERWLKPAGKLWKTSHELLLGIHFCTLVFGTRLHRLILGQPICKNAGVGVNSLLPQAWR